MAAYITVVGGEVRCGRAGPAAVEQAWNRYLSAISTPDVSRNATAGRNQSEAATIAYLGVVGELCKMGEASYDEAKTWLSHYRGGVCDKGEFAALMGCHAASGPRQGKGNAASEGFGILSRMRAASLPIGDAEVACLLTAVAGEISSEGGSPGDGEAVLTLASAEFLGDRGAWSAVRDAQGRTYYWDRTANETQWDPPTASQVRAGLASLTPRTYESLAECAAAAGDFDQVRALIGECKARHGLTTGGMLLSQVG